MPDKTRNKQGKFLKGQSGNPSGRPIGSRGQATILAEKIMYSDIAEIVQNIVDQAKEGNVQCQKMILDRIVPVRENSFVFEIPDNPKKSDVVRTLVDSANHQLATGMISTKQYHEFKTMLIDLTEAWKIYENVKEKERDPMMMYVGEESYYGEDK